MRPPGDREAAAGPPPETLVAWQAAYRDHRLERARRALVLSGAVVALIFIADAIVEALTRPEQFAATFVVRLVVGTYALAVAWLARRRVLPRAIPALAMILAVGVAVDVALAARQSGGIGSPYATGELLLLIGGGLLFPLEWTEQVVLTASVWTVDLTLAGTAGVSDGRTWTTHLFFLASATFVATAAVLVTSRLRRREFMARAALAHEQARSERLLLNVLPAPIAARLKETSEPIADAYAEVTVLFADIVGFTRLSSDRPPEEIVTLLDRVFSAFDELTERYGLEKIKTIGDAYMAVAGLPEPVRDHAAAAAAMALQMQGALRSVADDSGPELQVRVGLHTGPVVAGVIGAKKFIYDIWGDTVNVASRMESHGEPGRVQASDAVHARLLDRFTWEPRGEIEVKGKGRMRTWWLVGAAEPPEE